MSENKWPTLFRHASSVKDIVNCTGIFSEPVSIFVPTKCSPRFISTERKSWVKNTLKHKFVKARAVCKSRFAVWRQETAVLKGRKCGLFCLTFHMERPSELSGSSSLSTTNIVRDFFC